DGLVSEAEPSQATDSEEEKKLIADFCLSTYQSNELHNLLHYCRLSGIDPAPVLTELYDSEALPASDKRKGTKIFEQFKSTLLASVR
ncbi:MAG: hypothetical protein J6Z06_04125, partial [Lachnospiraceae bacterium]|nr:hypothetical protein [Lachnospiraceae bacterium]